MSAKDTPNTDTPLNSPDDPHNWTEDYGDEDNGRYAHQCRDCGSSFIGHKRRPPQCRVCAATRNAAPTHEVAVEIRVPLPYVRGIVAWMIDHAITFRCRPGISNAFIAAPIVRWTRPTPETDEALRARLERTFADLGIPAAVDLAAGAP